MKKRQLFHDRSSFGRSGSAGSGAFHNDGNVLYPASLFCLGSAVCHVRFAKSLGANVYAEASPHHFTLNEEAVLKHGSFAKMNPPLRTEEDRLAIIEGLKDDTIEIIATDHAPHSKEEKENEFTKCPSGITGLETSLGLGITTLVNGGHLDLMHLLEKMTIHFSGVLLMPTPLLS